jgi:hypothetical protein
MLTWYACGEETRVDIEYYMPMTPSCANEHTSNPNLSTKI